MTKILVPKEVSSISFSELDCTTLGKVSKRISELIAQYGEDAQVNKEQVNYSDYEYISIQVMELESDQQYEIRIEYEKELAEARVRRDRADFERLKKMFDI